MPLLTRSFIKIGFVYLGVSLLIALITALQPFLGLPTWIAAFRPVYLHFFMVGWVLQIIIGIAFWMFPKLSKTVPRGSEKLGWLVFLGLNAGLILRGIGEPMSAFTPNSAAWLLIFSAALQWIACVGFIANTWGRVKER